MPLFGDPNGNTLLVEASDGIFSFARAVSGTVSLVGSWHITGPSSPGDAGGTSVITFLADGTYLFAQDGDSVADPNGHDGMERGTYTWNSETGAFTSITTADTNGQWGLSHPLGPLNLLVDGDTLNATAEDGSFSLSRVADATNPIVGGWYLTGEGEDNSTAAITFLADGTYIMAEDGEDDATGHDGMERGTYTWNASTGKFSFVTTLDTSGEWGLSHSVIDGVTVASTGNGDPVLGTPGNDTLAGGADDDYLFGGSGNDTLNGVAGNDTLVGGAGKDTLNGGGGNDKLSGGTGNDTYKVNAGGDAITEAAAGGGTDLVQSTATSYKLASNVENLTLEGSANLEGTGNAEKNVLTGNSGQNTLDGGGGNDTLNGGNGRDTLLGGTGNDTLSGGAGNDVLEGLAGADVLSGGAGADRFDFDAVGDSGLTAATRDSITDFSHSQGDRIDLSTIDANGSGAGNGKFSFIGGGPFTGNSRGKLRYDATHDILYGSTDADTAAEFSIQLPNLALVVGDFIL